MSFRLGAVAVVVVLAAWSSVACDTVMTTAGSGKAQTVNVGDNFFTPDSAPVNAGDTVYWIWGGGAGHDVRDGSGNLWCGIRSVGLCYRVFPSAGKFRYYCSLHTGMVGTIDVH